MNTKYPLILGSQSPRRQKILKMLGFAFEVVPAKINESRLPQGLSPVKVPLFLSVKKALFVSRLRKGCLVLGCDTVIIYENTLLGKPTDFEEAKKMLVKLNGKTHSVISGLALARNGKTLATSRERTLVKFARNKKSFMEKYASTNEPLDKAGSYAIQGKGAQFIEKINGCYYNVVGLPIQKTIQILKPYIY